MANNTLASMNNRDYNRIITILVLNYQYSACYKQINASIESNRIDISTRDHGGKYRCRPIPGRESASD